jgi:hypothetical protein
LLVTTSYLAASYHNKQVYHLSSEPLSHVLFPNIHPILVPAISSSVLPVAQGLFGAVFSLSLPSLMPSSDIPQILKSVNRCLAIGGTFHLTIIDPMPVAHSIGPLLRLWLEEHLIFNLERQFRCTNPAKLLSIWLADACLRAEGSTITTVKFQAAPPSAESDEDGESSDNGVKDDRRYRSELRSIVGRMLWMEVWGSHISADTWWFDDPEILEECNSLGTFWEYHIIEAVKE